MILCALAAPGAEASDESAPAANGRALDPGRTLELSIERMHDLFDWDEAEELLRSLDPDYRVRGNEAYHRGLQKVFLLLKSAGFAETSSSGDSLELLDLGPTRPGWTPRSATLLIEHPDEIMVLSFEDEGDIDRVFLCPNSFPTSSDGVVAPLVRFEHGKPVESYAGTVVYGNLPVEDLFERAVQQGHALGVVSSYMPGYNDSDDNPSSIRYHEVPYDAERRGFGLNLSQTKRNLVERLLSSGLVYVRVSIDARFSESRGRTLVARIAGSDPQAGTVVCATTADEPGANDNASGMVTTAAMAAGYLRAIAEGRVERPRRSITFLFGPEIEGSREWLKTGPGAVDLAMVVDMVGQDPAKTGAVALVERMPDPGAIWDRPPLDAHSEWGRGDVRESDLQGSFLNDYVMAAMNLRAAGTGWKVRSNPYEGGSDQGEFLERGIPSVLLWHFTDTYYHTSLDRLEMVSREEMGHVAAATLGLVHHFAQAGGERAIEVLEIVMAAARRRLNVEAGNARSFLAVPAVMDDEGQRQLVLNRERQILLAWSRWYREAVLSIDSFDRSLGHEQRTALEQGIDAGLRELREIEREVLESL